MKALYAFVFVASIASASAAAASSSLKTFGLGFSAPTINGSANDSMPATGEIIFDTASSSFKGNSGTPSSPNWVGLSLSPNSEVTAYQTTGYGSSGTAIRTWSTPSVNVGSDITYASDATNGDTFTANTAGLYSISYCDEFNLASNLGLSKNSSQLSTEIEAITAADRMVAANTAGADLSSCVSTTLRLAPADVIRAHTGKRPGGTGGYYNESFHMIKVSN